MEYFLKGRVTDDEDAIYNELSGLKLPIGQDIKSQLVTIFNTTKNNGIRNKIAVIFSELEDPSIVPVLINKIAEIKYSGYISTLIYACSEYDCSEWIEFFVSLVIDLDDSSYIEAMSVISEMHKPLKLSEKIVCVKRLADYQASMDKGNEKYQDVEDVLEWIESKETIS
jgi:hypothetical protein